MGCESGADLIENDVLRKGGTRATFNVIDLKIRFVESDFLDNVESTCGFNGRFFFPFLF